MTLGVHPDNLILTQLYGSLKGDSFFMIKTLNQLEKEEFKNQGGTSDYLSDLSMNYYGAKTSSTDISIFDRERKFLKKRTGASSDSLTDLWRFYLLGKGLDESVSIVDMKRFFFDTVKFQGQIVKENIGISENITVSKS